MADYCLAGKEILPNYEIIDKDIELVYSPDDNGYYFQQYKMDGTGTSRISTLYETRIKAIEAYQLAIIKWLNWN